MATGFALPLYELGDWAGNGDDGFGVRWGVLDSDAYSGPGVRLRQADHAQTDGASRANSLRSTHVITLGGWATAPGRVAALSSVRAYKALFPTGGQRDLIRTDEIGPLRITVELADVPKVAWAGPVSFDWQLVLSATDPTWYETEETKAAADLGVDATSGLDFSGGLTFPLDFGSTNSPSVMYLHNGGTAAVRPRFVIANPVPQPVLTAPDGGRLEFSGDVGAGDRFTINCATKRVLLNGVSRRNDMVRADFASFEIPAGGSIRVAFGSKGYPTAGARCEAFWFKGYR